MLCLRPPLKLHLVVGMPRCVTFAAFDSFAAQRSDAGAPQVAVWVVRLSDGGIVAIT